MFKIEINIEDNDELMPIMPYHYWWREVQANSPWHKMFAIIKDDMFPIYLCQGMWALTKI